MEEISFKNKIIHSWNNTYSCDAKIFYPNNLKEISLFFDFINNNEKKYIVRTGECSYDSKSIPVNNDTLVLSLQNFNKFLKLNKKRKIVCVQSGMRLLDLVNILKIKGYKLSSIPGGEKISVGGAVAANVIGKDSNAKFSSFGDNVNKLSILRNGNNIKKISRSNKEFLNYIGSFGMGGLILEVELKIQKIKSPNVELETKITDTLKDLKKELDKESEYKYAQLDPFFSKKNKAIIFYANTSNDKTNKYLNKNFNINFFDKLLFFISSYLLNSITWMYFYKLFFYFNNKDKKIIDLHNFHYSSKYKHLVPKISDKGIIDIEILINKNFLKNLSNILSFLKKEKIYCIYIVIKKISKSKYKYFYSFNDNGYSVAMSFAKNKNSKIIDFFKIFLKKNKLKINLSKTDYFFIQNTLNIKSNFKSLYKEKLMKHHGLSR